MKTISLVITVFVLFTCCNTPASQPVIVKKDIYPKDSFWLNIKLRCDSSMGLKSLESGVDSFELRFWVDNQMFYGDNVFRIAYENGKWVNQNYFFIDNLGDTSVIHPISNVTVAGNSFFDSSRPFLVDAGKVERIIKQFKLESFPTQTSLPEYKGCCFDGTVYYLELATRHSYRFIVYENPDCCKEKSLQNKRFKDFIEQFYALLPELERCWPLCWKKDQ
jgi:hypothetical protein